MAHPWMTFLIICVALVAMSDIIESFCDMVMTIITARRYEPLDAGKNKEGNEEYAGEDNR